MSSSGITIWTDELWGKSVHLTGKKIATLESRIREIHDDTGMSFADMCREGLRLLVINYDRPLEPKDTK